MSGIDALRRRAVFIPNTRFLLLRLHRRGPFGLWGVVGSTNCDYRSFDLNDEVNLAARDAELVQRLASDFGTDVANSREISYDEWRRRSIFERAPELFGWVFERQQ